MGDFMPTALSLLVSSRLRCGALLAGSMLLLGACSSAPVQLSGPSQSWHPNTVSETAHARAEIVIYRDDKRDKTEQAPVLWGDERLLGALLPGQYLSARFCGETAELRVDPSQPGFLPSRHRLPVDESGTQFYRLSKAMGQYHLHTVSQEQAEKALRKLERQSHVVNRQARSCEPPRQVLEEIPEPMPEPVLLREVAIGADALFRFGSSDMKDILPEGRDALDELARDIRSSIQVKRIHIVGHTDRLGSDAFNDRLSQQRAETVAAYLSNQGVSGNVQVSGRGKRDPVSDCPDYLPRQQLIGCLQPDRRVAIELWGVQDSSATR